MYNLDTWESPHGEKSSSGNAAPAARDRAQEKLLDSGVLARVLLRDKYTGGKRVLDRAREIALDPGFCELISLSGLRGSRCCADTLPKKPTLGSWGA